MKSMLAVALLVVFQVRFVPCSIPPVPRPTPPKPWVLVEELGIR